MFTYKIENGYCAITGYKGEVPSELVIPETIEGATVCSIVDNAFAGCTTLEKVILPPTVQMIGHKAFKDCKNLKTINTENVTHLRPDVFEGTVLA